MSGLLPALAHSNRKAVHNLYSKWLDHSVLILQESWPAFRIPFVCVTTLFIYAYPRLGTAGTICMRWTHRSTFVSSSPLDVQLCQSWSISKITFEWAWIFNLEGRWLSDNPKANQGLCFVWLILPPRLALPERPCHHEGWGRGLVSNTSLFNVYLKLSFDVQPCWSISKIAFE